MIVDTAQDIRQIGLRIEAVHFGGLDDGHRAGQRLGTGIGPGKEPVLSADSNRAQGAFGWIVVDGHPAILKEEAERGTPAEAIAEGLGQIALAGDQVKLVLRPSEEGLDLLGAVLLACGQTDIGGTTGDLPLDVVKRADLVERLAGDSRFRLAPFIMEVTSEVRPACRLDKAG